MKKSRVTLTSCCLIFAAISFFNIADAVSVSTGEQAPDFTLLSTDGSTVSLTDFKGSVVVFIYFRLEQTRSVMALEEINNIRTKYGEKEVQFIGISAEKEKKDELINQMNELNIDFPVLLDVERDLYASYGIRVYPTTLIIDREGNVADAMPGHVLSYKVRLDSTLQYVLGKIDETQRNEIISPGKKEIDEKALYAEREYNLAIKFTEARLFDQAIGFAKQSIEAKPDMVKSHILLGYLYLDARETDNAVEQFEKAAAIDPSSYDARTGLGGALIEKGNIEMALEVLIVALRLNPNPHRTLYELGKAYELKGDKESAHAMYKKAIEKIKDKHVLPSSLARCR